MTLFGTFDPSVANQKITYGNGDSVTQNLVRNNSQGTSQISFKGVEDLGGGLKASFLIENDFTAGVAGSWNAGGGELFAALAGGFGTLKAGAPNTPTLTAQAASQPFGTKIGGGFALTNSGKVRNSNTVMYSSPAFSGFSVSIANSFKTKADTNPAKDIDEVAGITDIGLTYANGPLVAGFTNYKAAKTVAAASKTDNNLYATYDLGVAKLGAGYYTQKQTALADAQGYNLSVAVPMGAVTLMANYGSLNSKLASNKDATIVALGAKYSLSKTTSLYGRYVDQKNENAAADAAKKTTTLLAGMQINF